MKQIGKTYDAEGFGSQTCPDCMRVSTNDTFLRWPEMVSYKEITILQTIRVALCPCGNVFVRQLLQEEFNSNAPMTNATANNTNALSVTDSTRPA